MTTLRVALIQTTSSKAVQANLERIAKVIEDTVRKDRNIKLVVLPENFACTYNSTTAKDVVESIPDGQICKAISKMAKDNGVHIVAGTILEVDAQRKMYNTCTVWSPKGELLAKHRKGHLYDVNMKTKEGNLAQNESSYLTPGNDLTMVTIDGHKVGIAICHEMRFEEMAKCYRKEGCEMIVYPANFNTVDGPLHWEVLNRARAIDNQVFVVSVGKARDNSDNSYVSYGHSMIVDPWGQVVKHMGTDEGVIVTDIDFKKVAEVREQIPIFKQRRTDLYDTVCDTVWLLSNQISGG